MHFLASNMFTVGLLLVGVLLCFAGYRSIKGLIWVIGFLVGLVLTASIAFAWFDFSQISALGIGLLGGIVGALLLGFLYFAGVFVIGAAFGASLGGLVASEMNMDPTAFVGIVAIVGGCLALVLQKLIIIISTAGVGAWCLLGGIASFLGYASPLLLFTDPFAWWASLRVNEWLVFLLIAFFIFGIMMQWNPRARKGDKRQSEKTNP